MRRLLSLLFVSLIVAGCASAGGTNSSNLPDSPVVVSPYIQGLSASELDAYLSWWRKADVTSPADGWQGAVISAGAASNGVATTTVHPPLDPGCPLRYDYEKMGSTLFEGGDGLQLREVSGNKGFYNPTRSEALFILRGTSVEAGGKCDDKSKVGWLVARVNLLDGEERWIIDGLASPAATLTIAVDPGNKTIKVKSNKVELDDSAVAGYSPFRLRRFAITDSNRERALEFAKIGRGNDQIGRRLLWFRASDLAGAYRATGCGPIAAFWGPDNGCADLQDLAPEAGATTNVWLDEMARQGEVIKRNEDDTYCGVSGTSCLALNNELWSKIGETLTKIAQNAGKQPTDTAASSAQMSLFARLLGGAGGGKANYCSGALQGVPPSGSLDGDRVGATGGLAPFALAPVGGVSVEPDERDLIVRWRALAGASGYQIRAQLEGSTSWRTPVGAPASATSATLRGLGYGKSYFIEVRALPDGAWSEPVKATIGPGSGGGGGGGGSISPNGNCSYKLDWAIPAARLPDELIHHSENGVAYPYADVFGVVVAGGTRAWDDTRDRMKESVALQELVGYFATRDENSGDSVTLSPSFRFVGGEDAEWYKRFSYLFGEAKSYGPASMTFSTASSGQKTLRYDPSPASQIRITVTDTLNPNTKVTYKSEWLPTQAIGDFDSPTSALGECGTFDFGCHITRAITGFTMSIYQATFGQMVEGLSKGTVGNLLGVPILQQYEIDAVRDIAGGQQVIYKLNEERLRENPDSTKIGEPGEAPCLTLAQSGQLNRFDPPNSSTRAEPEAAQYCYQESGTWGLFNAARGIMVILLVIFTARYVISLMLGRDRQMTIMAFTARAFLSLFLIVYVGDVLRFLGTIVAEVIVITNSIGSQVSGKPYSHLWMFSAYLNSPPAGANPFALILMAPFTILGLLVVAIVGWVRLVFAGLVVAMSPIWIVNLLSARQPNFFYTSLLLLLRLYVIPIMALILMLAIFLLLGANDSFFGSADDVTSIPRAVIGAIILVVVAIAPIFMAKFTIERIGRPVTQSIQAALSAADDDRAENFLNNTGRDTDGPERPYGDPSKIRTEGTLAAGAAGYAGGELAAGSSSAREGGIGSSGGSVDEPAPSSGSVASDPVTSLSAGQSSGEQLAASARARELGVTTDELRLSEGKKKTERAIDARTQLYLDRGYDEAAAKEQATRDIKGEEVRGGWSRRAFSLGASGAKGVLGGMLGDSGIGAAAKESLPGWAQSGIAKAGEAGGGAKRLANEAVARLTPLASSALERQRTGVAKLDERRRAWIAAEGETNVAREALAKAKSSGDPVAIESATKALRSAETRARSKHRALDEQSRSFSGRMAATRIVAGSGGLRRRDGVTTDATAVRANLDRLDGELSRLRADRLIRESSGGARATAALEKLDAKIAALEARRAAVGGRVAAYDTMGEVTGRRRADAARAAATRAKTAANRARSIDEIYRREAATPLAPGDSARQSRLAALEERRIEARRNAELAAERARRLGAG